MQKKDFIDNFVIELTNCNFVERLTKQLEEKNEELKYVERSLEGTIDKQYDEIQKLKIQLAEKNAMEIGRDAYKQRYQDLKEENLRYKQALAEIEKILDTRHKQGQCFCDIRLPLILDIINKAKEQ